MRAVWATFVAADYDWNMNTKMTSACLGLVAAACVALTAQTAQAADRSDEADPQAFASLGDFQTLARSGPDLCPQEFSSGAFALEVCTRNSAAFWAHDTAGRLHKFSLGSSVETRAIHPSEIDSRIAVSDQGGVAFTREESPNGAVTFTVVDDETMLFPGASELFAVMFLDAPLTDENGELDELMYWQHFNGGKFAE